VLVIRYFIYIFSFHPFNRRFCSAADSRLTKSVKDCYNAPVVQGRIYGRLEAFFERIQANPCGLPFTHEGGGCRIRVFPGSPRAASRGGYRHGQGRGSPPPHTRRRYRKTRTPPSSRHSSPPQAVGQCVATPGKNPARGMITSRSEPVGLSPIAPDKDHDRSPREEND